MPTAVNATENDVTELLGSWNEGDTSARDRLIALVADDLKDIARRHFRREPPGHTLEPTALVSELYLKLVRQRRVRWGNRRDFFAVASELIRRILVDHARKRLAARRGAGAPKVAFDEALGLGVVRDDVLVGLGDGLADLEREDPRGSRVVELHVFGGLTFDEIAQVMDVTRRTAFRDWKHARLWLRRYLNGGSSGPGGDA